MIRKGRPPSELAWLIWFFTALCAVVWFLVMIVLLVALLRRVQPADEPLVLDCRRPSGAWRGLVVAAPSASTAAILVGLTLLSFFANRTLAAIGSRLDADHPGHRAPMVVGGALRGRPARPDPRPPPTRSTSRRASRCGSCSNSTDVIHSFWVPNLPASWTSSPATRTCSTLEADSPASIAANAPSSAACSMRIWRSLVIAEPRAAFEAWRNDQLKPAAEPGVGEPMAGRDLFLEPALRHVPPDPRHRRPAARSAPDLTHVASRTTLAAGTLPMSRGNLAAWIADPQGIKPGANMPVHGSRRRRAERHRRLSGEPRMSSADLAPEPTGMRDTGLDDASFGRWLARPGNAARPHRRALDASTTRSSAAATSSPPSSSCASAA